MQRLVAVPVMAVLAWISAGCKATPPGKVETAVITRAEGLFIPNKAEKNPLPFTQQNLAAGRQAFSHYCVACHGMDGQNTGIPFAGRMSPPVPSLASPQAQSFTDGQLKWIIDNGIALTGMPGSRGILADDEIWSTIVFIRRLPPAGSLGEPAMYSK